MTVTVDRQGAPVGTPVTFTLQATSGESCCGLRLLHGDGSSADARAAEPCGGGQGSPGTRSVTVSHPYNKAGRWEFNFQVHTGNCNTDYHSYASFFGWVYVDAGGTPTAQGPAQPRIEGGWAYSPDGHDATGLVVKVGGHGRDDDGYIHHFSIDWGDGTTSTSPGDPMGCQATPSGWPAASDALYPPNGSSTPVSHEYASPGSYAVVVTVHSTGCDGTMDQTASWSAVWNTDGPNP